MKALVIAREGRKALLLLPGGEMRTVRARRNWQTGMEVAVKPYSSRRGRPRADWRAVVYPMAACAAAFVLAFGGMRLLGGGPDRRNPAQPLASGYETSVPQPEETLRVEATPVPTPLPADPEPTETVRIAAESTPQPTPERRCDECGGYGHDDDSCPNEKCDECGEYGHDDDSCPNEKCDECGGYGHDDDSCPNEKCDECGEYGHDDDSCPNEKCDECGEYGHDDDSCPNEKCDECGEYGHDDDHCPDRHGGGGHHDD